MLLQGEKSMSNFIEKCLSREAAPEDIDDYIELWHENPGRQALHEFLGMTRDEYAGWIADATSIANILNSRKYSGSSAPSALPDGTGR
jgi:methyl coenzyme M reductase alpha subunit